MSDCFQPAELQQALLDSPTLNQLFSDIASETTFIGALLKGAATSEAADQFVSLEAAKDALISGTVRGVQLRYQFAQEEWWDTLLSTPQGVRIVRINHSAAVNSG